MESLWRGDRAAGMTAHAHRRVCVGVCTEQTGSGVETGPEKWHELNIREGDKSGSQLAAWSRSDHTPPQG